MLTSVRFGLFRQTIKPLLPIVSNVKDVNFIETNLRRGFRLEGDPKSTVKLEDLPKDYSHVELPEKRRLPILEKVPQIPGLMKNPYSLKRMIDIRGPELVHNKLIYKQFGVIALSGTQLRSGHIDAIRLTVNRMMDDNKMFAYWRIDAPWKARTKKGIGKTLGGGKGSIDHYVSPVKAGRVILEMGGKVEFKEIEPILQQVVYKLPCDALIVSDEVLSKLFEEEKELEKRNINPFTFKYVVDNNMRGCDTWISPYDTKYYNKYI